MVESLVFEDYRPPSFGKTIVAKHEKTELNELLLLSARQNQVCLTIYLENSNNCINSGKLNCFSSSDIFKGLNTSAE